MSVEYHTAVGDILLVAGKTKPSKVIVGLQKVFYRRARSSHAAICLGGGVFIHSMPDKGVHLAYLPDILAGCSDKWRVIRLRSLTVEQERQLLASTNYYLAQGYNKAFMMPGNASSSFCSELAIKAYTKAGLVILGGRKPSQTGPAHFDEQADKLTDWADVSSDYRTLLKYIEANPELSYMEYFYTAYRLERVRRRNASTEIMLRIASELFPSEGMQSGISRIRQELDKVKLFSYWDINPSRDASQFSDTERQKAVTDPKNLLAGFSPQKRTNS